MIQTTNFYDKDKLKEQLETEQVFDLLDVWGGEPEYTNQGIVSRTICHNLAHEGRRKLYYYTNTKLFKCYTDCSNEGGFDIFDLCIKVMRNQEDLDWELYDAMKYIASYFGFQGEAPQKQNNEQELDDWDVFKRHENKPHGISLQTSILKEYNPVILTRFLYPRIYTWEREGITAKVARRNIIGYYPTEEQITIPHFDINNRLIGIRGRYLEEYRAEHFGKYRPLAIGKQIYSHPLSMNLYNLNNSKENIKKAGVAIIYEAEKSTLLTQSYYGHANDISVACCGSSISRYHIQLLREAGAKEVILAFDRQFQEIGDEEFKRLKNKILHLYGRYGNVIKITAIFDKDKITGYKSSPIDEGPEKFEYLLKNRITF